MNKILQLCILSIMIGSMLWTVQVPNNVAVQQHQIAGNKGSSVHSKITTTLTDHAPINITGDSGFSSCSCVTGVGSASNPYVIENYFINGGKYGIEIEFTSYYFIIRNVWINGSTQFGMYIGYLDNAVISNDTITHSGEYFLAVNNITITGNTINDSPSGISISGNNNVISNNTINNVLGTGMDCNGAHNTLSNNTIGNAMYGIYSVSSSYSDVTFNTIHNTNYDGMNILSNYNSIFINNTISETRGMTFRTASNETVANNTVSNSSDDFLFSQVYNSSISNNIATTSQNTGFLLESSNNNTLANNTATASKDKGFELDSSNNNTLFNNTACFEKNGFWLNNASNNVLANNTACNNSVSDLSVYYKSANETLHNNTFSIIRYPSVPSSPIFIGWGVNTVVTSITINWYDFADGGSPIIQFILYRSSSPNGPFTVINKTLFDTVVDQVNASSTYYYYVVAVNALGTSNASAILVKTPFPPIGTTSSGSKSATSTSTPPYQQSSISHPLTASSKSLSITTSKSLSFSSISVILATLGCLILNRKRIIKNKK